MTDLLHDPELVLVTHLRALLADRPEPYATGARVDVLPAGSTEAPGLPFVQVAHDGTPSSSWPRTDRATVRVTCWAPNRTPAKDLARLVQALVGAAPCPPSAWSVRGLLGPQAPVRDDTGATLVWQTFRVAVRPVRH